MKASRNAMTLIELIVIVSILLILTVMLIPAVIRSIALSERVASSNNLRVIMQGIQQYAIERQGKLPGVALDNQVMNSSRYPLYAILPYIDSGFISSSSWGVMGSNGMEYPRVKYYLSPTDISTSDSTLQMSTQFENTSYSTNAQVFNGSNRMSSINDGLGYTIGISERYRGCYNNGVDSCIFVSRGVYPILESGTKFRISTFADSGYNDVVPVTLNGISGPSVAGYTFQVSPTVQDANGSLLQATQSTGLLTAMMDGSVRTFAAGVKSEIFWGAVTAKGNEVFILD